jgi:hypothetical protein
LLELNNHLLIKNALPIFAKGDPKIGTISVIGVPVD